MLQAAWFSGSLITVDTALVTGTMYLSGHARSELYLAYFILMLIAASLRRLSHVIAFSLLLCAGYGVVLYQGIVQTGALSVGHLLGVPVLLVMAIFYGMALETIGSERQQKTQLLHNIEALKHTEQTLQASREQLEIRIKGLKDDLSKANAMVQQEKSERQGLERQLFEAQKMEAIGRITSGLANEFSHLFSVIGKQTGVVLSHLLPEDPLYGAVDEIFRTGEQACRSHGAIGDARPSAPAIPSCHFNADRDGRSQCHHSRSAARANPMIRLPLNRARSMWRWIGKASSKCC